MQILFLVGIRWVNVLWILTVGVAPERVVPPIDQVLVVVGTGAQVQDVTFGRQAVVGVVMVIVLQGIYVVEAVV